MAKDHIYLIDSMLNIFPTSSQPLSLSLIPLQSYFCSVCILNCFIPRLLPLQVFETHQILMLHNTQSCFSTKFYRRAIRLSKM